MTKQSSTENIGIIRKHTWQVPFRVSMYEIEDGRRFVLLEGGKHKPSALRQASQTGVNMELSGVNVNQTSNAWTITPELQQSLMASTCYQAAAPAQTVRREQKLGTITGGEAERPTNAHPPLPAAFGHSAGPSR